MTSKKLYYGMLGLIVLLLIGLVFGVQSADNLLNQKAATLTKLKAKDQAADYEQKRLIKAKQAIQQYADLEKIAKVVVPEDKDQAETVRELANIAGANGVKIGAITFPTSSLGAIVSGNGSSSASTSNTSSSTSVGSAPAAPKPQSPDSPANKLSQLLAVPSLPGVYQLTISVANDTQAPISFAQLTNFLQDLENNRRTAQVTTLNIQQPDPTHPSLLDFTLTLNEYIK